MQTIPTTVELLTRIDRHLSLQGAGEFSHKWEMARWRCRAYTIATLLGNAQMDARFEAQRAELAHLSR